MWKYYPELLERPVPRYTSYPTAADFNNDVGAAELEQALAQVKPCDDISLYAHIPYCDQICWYCGCNTGRANRTQRLNAYMAALFGEIELVARKLGHHSRVKRIAFGGGSPNAISADGFAALMDHLSDAFSLADPVKSIELDPRSFTPEWCDIIAAMQIGNVSLGVQSFDPAVQAAIGRVQPLDMVSDMIDNLRSAGVSSLNFDLMYGLPGQTEATLMETLEATLTLKPDRIALFGYAHIPTLIPRQRQIDDTILPDAKERFDMAATGYDFLIKAGYQAIGFDHFALPTDPLGRAGMSRTVRRNFQGFTDDQSDILIGLGASAISEFPGYIVQNEKNSGRYRELIAQNQLAAVGGVKRSISNQVHGVIIEEILANGEADLTPLGSVSGKAEILAPFINRGLVEIVDQRVCLHESAKPYARTIAATFDEFRKASTGTFSQAI
ncbi:oxygen-independent coproporphyrinogen III oxidase [Sphingorhabdus sp. Alg231-15]|uniref:oxygen-independent coproporphyrinogen III oxidase n=1 Tax=Sphingorhabdus sp. Alg231-15 TaxID=1922222 RepID=UPI000D55423D